MSLTIASQTPGDTPAPTPSAPETTTPAPAPVTQAPAEAPAPAPEVSGEQQPDVSAPPPAPETAKPQTPVAAEEGPTDEPSSESAEGEDTTAGGAAEPADDASATGVVVSDTTAPVGQASDTPAPKNAESFLDKVEATAEDIKAAALGILDFEPEAKAFIIQCIDEGSDVTKGLIKHVLDYVKRMGPTAPVSPTQIDEHQVNWYTQLVSALEHPGKDFHAMMNCLLAIIHHHKSTGAFSMRHYARGMHSMPLDATKRSNFQALINLLRITSLGGAARKESLKQVDLGRSVAGLTEQAAERLKTFYRN